MSEDNNPELEEETEEEVEREPINPLILSYPEFILAMNEKSFQKLTPEQQKIVTEAANEVRDDLRKNAKAEDMTALEHLKEKGMQVYVVPEADLPEWQAATKPVWDIFVKHTGDLGKELIEICTKQ